MIPVLTVSQMRECEKAAMASGTSGRELMRLAGEGLAALVPPTGKVGILCGTGNNAGDGYVAALALHKAGRDCRLVLLAERFTPDGEYWFRAARDGGVPRELWSEKTDLAGYDVLVDCLFGTGFHGNAAGAAAEIIEKINAAGAFVVSADLPSGLGGDSGLGTPAVRADVTAVMGALKPGCLLGRAKDLTGALHPVSLPLSEIPENCGLIEPSDAASVFPPRLHDSHKGTWGLSAVMGGCVAYSGAAKLANLSLSALRSGGGVTRLIVPDCLTQGVLPYLLESTLAPLPSENGFFSPDTAALDEALSGVKSLSFGMGIGRTGAVETLLSHVLQTKELSLVIDADGLFALSRLPGELLRTTRCRVLVTPHLGEFSRLCGLSVEEIRQNPVSAARDYAREHRVTVLLKGPTTLVTDGETVLFSHRGCPGMGTAGSGDVLSGVLAGLLGFAHFSVLTAAAGAYLAGLAGELAQRDRGAEGMTASDTVSHLPEAIRQVKNG